MTVTEALQELRAAALVDEDGERVEPQWSPGLDPAAVAALEERLGARLPDDLREVLSHTAGIDGLLDQITFSGNEGAVAPACGEATRAKACAAATSRRRAAHRES